MRGSWGRTLVLASACALALSACSGGADEPETEVGGVALERDDDGDAVAVEDERGTTAEQEGLVEPDEPDDEVEGTEDLGDTADDATASPDGDGSDADATSGSGSATTSTGSSGTGSGTGASAPAPSPRATPAPAPTRTAAPAPAPSPTPTPTPAPRVLGSGDAVTGSNATGLGDDGWVVTSSTGPIEPGDVPPPFRVDVDVVGEGPIGEASCGVTLQAGEDRGLVAVGRATVTLVLTAEDGSVRRLTRQLLDLDVELAAGDLLQVDRSPPFAVDAREFAGATCEARFDRAG